jgi:hypothetical protein
MGYNALYIVKNFGTLCLTIFFGPLAWIACYFLAKLRFKRLLKWKANWNYMMRFNYWISLVNETFMFLAVCCGLNLFFYCRWDAIGNVVNSTMAIICSVAILLFPFFVAIWYSRVNNLERILKIDKEFLARFGNAIEGLNFKREGPKVLFYSTFSILRKLWLAHIVVFQQEKSLFSIFQVNF